MRQPAARSFDRIDIFESDSIEDIAEIVTFMVVRHLMFVEYPFISE